MKKAVVYIHGKNGSPDEAEHYRSFFPDCEVLGFDYRAETPWEAVEEYRAYFDRQLAAFESVSLIGNSIGAFFALCALGERKIERAWFISPVGDMEKLITDMMSWAGVSEDELREKGEIETAFGETLSWEYLSWVRTHPVSWPIPTAILYGDQDNLQSPETMRHFADGIGADLTVMSGGEHWFHTPEQMAFLDTWMKETV